MRIEHPSSIHPHPVAPENVLVFKTSVMSAAHVNALRPQLDLVVKDSGQWNFDLEDCDHILRVEAVETVRGHIAALLKGQGFDCCELE